MEIVMNQNIKVTVVTPSYNQGQFIEETILSVLNQTYKNIQYIIVDGGSTDNTMEIVKKYSDQIDIVIHEKDNGQSDAINKGFRLATGVLVGWLNSDDIYYPTCIEDIVALYRVSPEGSIYFPRKLDYIDGVGKLLHTRTSEITGKDFLLNQDYDVIQQGSFYSRDALNQVNFVNEDIYYCMDLDLWLRLLDKGPIYFTKGSALSAIRRWEETKSSNSGAKFVNNIQETINKYGAKKISKTQIKIVYIKLRILGGQFKRYLGFKTSIN